VRGKAERGEFLSVENAALTWRRLFLKLAAMESKAL